jgi:hypothetical protein
MGFGYGTDSRRHEYQALRPSFTQSAIRNPP